MRKSKKIFNIFMVMISLVCCLGMFTACKKKDDDKKPTAIAIAASMIELEYDTVVYDRLAKEPTVVLKSGETTIAATEYTIAYEDNVNVGTAKVTVAAKEGSTVVSGSASKEFTITVAELPAIAEIPYAVYSGDAQVPNVSISGLLSTDYDIAWEYKALDANDTAYAELNKATNNFVETGHYRVTATGKGNYQGTKTAVYSIYNPFGTISLNANEATYDGNSHTPVASVDSLTEGVDYEIAYAYKAPGATDFVTYTIGEGKESDAFVNAGEYRVIAKGLGIYGGEKYATFTIHAIDLPAATMSSGVSYDGTSKTPSYAVGGLTENQQYTTAWLYRTFDGEFTEYNLNQHASLNFISAGEYKLVVTGVGNYKGTQEIVYTISRANITATVSKENYTFNGDKGKLNISLGGVTETPTCVYYYRAGTHTTIGEASQWAEYSLELNLNAGIYSLYATVGGLTNYNTTTTAIIQFEVYKDELKGIPNISGQEYTYDGQSHDPQLLVTSRLGTGTLVEGVDYVLQWRRFDGENDVVYTPDAEHPELNFVDYGVYSVQLYGYGNYTITDRTAITCETYFTINKATMDTFTVQREGYIYGETPTYFVLKGVNGANGAVTLGATITYEVKKMGDTPSEWTVITKETPLECGTYIIRAKASGVANYNDKLTTSSATEANMFTISGAYLAEGDLTLAMTTPNDATTLSVSNNTDDDAVLTGATITYYYYVTGAEGSAQEFVKGTTVLEAGSYKIYAVVEDMTNYNDFTTNAVDYVVEA